MHETITRGAERAINALNLALAPARVDQILIELDENLVGPYALAQHVGDNGEFRALNVELEKRNGRNADLRKQRVNRNALHFDVGRIGRETVDRIRHRMADVGGVARGVETQRFLFAPYRALDQQKAVRCEL